MLWTKLGKLLGSDCLRSWGTAIRTAPSPILIILLTCTWMGQLRSVWCSEYNSRTQI